MGLILLTISEMVSGNPVGGLLQPRDSSGPCSIVFFPPASQSFGNLLHPKGDEIATKKHNKS